MILFWILIFLLMVAALCFVLLPVLATGHSTIGNKKISFFILAFGFPWLALISYFYLGDSNGLKQALLLDKQRIAVKQMQEKLKNPAQVISALVQHLQQDPSSTQGWFFLGKVYFSLQQYSEAASAFARAEQLSPDNPDVLFQYAQSLYFQQQDLTGKPRELLERLLRIDPHNNLAINLLAVYAYQRGDYRRAINYWEGLLPYYPSSSEDGQALLKAIAKAQTDLAQEKLP